MLVRGVYCKRDEIGLVVVIDLEAWMPDQLLRPRHACMYALDVLRQRAFVTVHEQGRQGVTYA